MSQAELSASASQTDAAVAIIVPTYREEDTIADCLQHLTEQSGPFEVVVVDGGSGDRTIERAQQWADGHNLSVQVITSPDRGRSAQMNWGAQQTDAEILLFLHADSRLPKNGLIAIRNALVDSDCIGGRFDVELDRTDWPYGAISWGINTRSRLVKAFTGDMGIFIRRSDFESLGGYPAWPIMEDLSLAEQMHTAGKVAYLRERMMTSSRRWEQGGPWRTVALMQVLRAGYRFGMSPEKLANWYRTVR